MNTARISVVGPPDSGKTVISNFLSDQTDQTRSEYSPTVGVRILEFEQQVSVGDRNQDGSVELWDCSGNQEYESCWPAMTADNDGVIIVYNPFNSSHSNEVQNWYNVFVSSKGLKDSQCCIFAHCRKKEASKNFTSPVSGVPFVVTNLESNSDGLKDAFSKFISKIFSRISASREREERNILS